MNTPDCNDSVEGVWFRQICEQAATAPVRMIPRNTMSTAEGAANLLDALALMEGFGLPEPDVEPIVHFDMRL